MAPLRGRVAQVCADLLGGGMAVEQHLHRFLLEFCGVDAPLRLGTLGGLHGTLLGCLVRVNLSSRSVHKTRYTSSDRPALYLVSLSSRCGSRMRMTLLSSGGMRFVCGWSSRISGSLLGLLTGKAVLALGILYTH